MKGTPKSLDTSCTKTAAHLHKEEMSELKEKIVMLEGSVELFNAQFSEPTKEVAHINKDISEEEKIFFHESSHSSYKASISAV